jgi:hypothetical protein
MRFSCGPVLRLRSFSAQVRCCSVTATPQIIMQFGIEGKAHSSDAWCFGAKPREFSLTSSPSSGKPFPVVLLYGAKKESSVSGWIEADDDLPPGPVPYDGPIITEALVLFFSSPRPVASAIARALKQVLDFIFVIVRAGWLRGYDMLLSLCGISSAVTAIASLKSNRNSRAFMKIMFSNTTRLSTTALQKWKEKRQHRPKVRFVVPLLVLKEKQNKTKQTSDAISKRVTRWKENRAASQLQVRPQ